MRILEHGEIDGTVRLWREIEGKRDLCDWVNCKGINCEDNNGIDCHVFEHIEESKKRFPDGMTYDEAKQFLEDK